MTVYPMIYLTRWSYARAPGRYPTAPAWRRIDVLTPRNHGRKKWREKTLHNYSIHRHIDPLYWFVKRDVVFWLQKYAESGV